MKYWFWNLFRIWILIQEGIEIREFHNLRIWNREIHDNIVESRIG